MNRFRPKENSFCIRHVVLCCFILCTYPLFPQGGHASDQTIHQQSKHRDDIPEAIGKDTLKLYKLNNRFKGEVSKKYNADLDSVRHYGHLVSGAFKNKGNAKGLIETSIGFGRIYLDKNVLDSSKYYFIRAIQESSTVRDTALLTYALLSYVNK